MSEKKSLFSPAKIIIFGEHSVLYGAPAIAIPTGNMGIEAIWEPTEKKSLNLILENQNVNMKPIQSAVTKLKTMIDFSGFKLTVSSYLPIGAGLGSSAAFSHILTQAALLASKYPSLTKKQLNNIVYELEKSFHRTPSGIDNTVVTYNKACIFAQNGINFDIPWIGYSPEENIYVFPPPKLNITVGYSGKTSSTSDMIKLLQSNLDSQSRILEFTRIMTEIFNKGIEKWSESDFEGMGSYMILAHHQYKTLGISTPDLDLMVRLAVDSGALGAKLTGAGGGGCVIALVTENTRFAVQESWEEAGFSVII